MLKMFAATLASLHRCQYRVYDVVSLFCLCLVLFALLAVMLKITVLCYDENLSNNESWS